MRKALLVLAALALILGMSAISFAGFDPETKTMDGNEVDTYVLTNAGWVSDGRAPAQGVDENLNALSRLWTSGGYYAGNCNKDRGTEVSINASVAQWCDWFVSGTEWSWLVRKPGDYCGDCISFSVKSNGNVSFNFSNFENLVSNLSLGDTEIEIYYAQGGQTPPDPTTGGWVSAADLNNLHPVIEETRSMHVDYTTFKLWNWIHVETCNSACEYTDDAYVTVVLAEQKAWIDPDPTHANDFIEGLRG